MAPFASHDKVGERLADTGSEFSFFEFVGQGIWVARIANRDGGDGLPVVGNVEDFARLVGVEPRHLMNVEPIGDRLEAELSAGAPDIVKGMCVRFAFLISDLRDGNRQHGRVLGPALIELNHRAQNLVEVFFVVLRGDDVGPRLRIAARRRPSGRFEDTLEDGGRDLLIAEGPGTPAMEHKFV